MKYSIVIPCYNEKDNLPTLIEKIVGFSSGRDIEFILVENGSKDGSYSVMQSLVKDNSVIKIVKVDVNQGYGYGLQQGINVASGDYIGWIHADMQLPLEEVSVFLDYIDSYKGSEKLFLKGIRHNRSIIDYVFTYSQGLFDSVLLRTWMFDISAIPTFFDRELVSLMNDVPKDFSIEIYIYALAKKKCFQVTRFPVHIFMRKKGKSSWNTGLWSRIKQSMRIIKASFDIKRNLQ